jgi:pimeloyl-ACP methyl ester carboxylesterase
MPELERSRGVEIHWEEQGEGPLVVIAHQILWSYPKVYGDLIGDLARDHRVVFYDARGCGQSTRQGPYDTKTDAEDLGAVIEAAGGDGVVMAVGYGYNVSVRVATTRPELISTVVAVVPAAAAILPRSELTGSDVLAASESVMDMLTQMMSTDPRAALRTMLTATNPNLDDDQVRERVDQVAAYVSADSALDRARTWLADDPSEHARLLGNRLWLLQGRTEPLFEGALIERVAELYPEAHLEEVPDGAISRPDVTAAWIRRITAQATEGSRRE